MPIFTLARTGSMVRDDLSAQSQIVRFTRRLHESRPRCRPEGLSVDPHVHGFQIAATAAQTAQPIRNIDNTRLFHRPLKPG